MVIRHAKNSAEQAQNDICSALKMLRSRRMPFNIFISNNFSISRNKNLPRFYRKKILTLPLNSLSIINVIITKVLIS